MIELKIGIGDGKRLRRGALIMLCLALALWLAYLVRDIWLPLFIALLIAMVLDPMVDRMEKRGWSRLKSSILIFGAFFVVAGVTLTLAVPAVVTQTVEVTRSLGDYLPSGDNETQTKRSLQLLLKRLHATPFVENTVLHASRQISQGFGNASEWVGKTAQSMASNLLWVVVIPIVAFYLLKDFHILIARLLMLIPRDQRAFTQLLINEISGIFVRYLRGMLVVCALNAVATTLLLMCFRVPNAVALGAIAGALYVVPYLGPALTYTMIGGTCLVTGTIPMQTILIILALMIVLHSIVFDQIIAPRIVGQHVGLHPVLSIIALLIGGSLLGIFGMLIAVPTAAVIQMVLTTVFPRLTHPIEVPVGEQLHEILDEAEHAPGENPDEAESAQDVHQSILEAVDQAEQAAEEALNHEGLELPGASHVIAVHSRGGKSVSPLG
ncbi:MAG TPA: AI-2E family transporter [Chthonomonadaceae bacterium]|nr:AI-2E family transporter [Chthonomonadaceae bacterium]